VSSRYTIANNFVENLISLVVRYKPKKISINRYNFIEISRVSREGYHPQLSFNPSNNKVNIKAQTQIRNPNDFSLFITTYVESLLVLDRGLGANTVIFSNNYTQGEYVEEAIRNYAEGELQSQAFLTITTQQGTYEEVTIESQSSPFFVSLKSQSNESIQTQSYQPIEMPTYTYEARVPISDSSGKSLTGSFYDRTNLMPILAKGAAITSYTRTYTA
jgi:hypothetical protein